MRVLVVEDDPAVADFVGQGFRESSFAVDVAEDGPRGRQMAGEDAYDVIVLDLMLPGLSGFGLLRELRQQNVATPVICLTARDTVDDRVRGLNLGADDYLVKPFSFAELLARVHALLRRGQAVQQNPIVVGDLTIDTLSRHVQRRGRRLDLSPRECALLEYLGRNTGQVPTRTMILEHVWDMNQDPMTNVLETWVPANPLPEDEEQLTRWVDRICQARAISAPRVLFVLDASNHHRDYFLAPPEDVVAQFALTRHHQAPAPIASYVYDWGVDRSVSYAKSH